MLGELAALGAALCWAVGSHLYGRIGRHGDVPAGAMNLGKCFTGVVLFGLTGLLLTGRVMPAMPWQTLAWLSVSGVVGLSLGDGAFLQAILSLGVRRAILMLSMAPVFVAVGGALWLNETLRVRDAAAILAVLAGVGAVVYEQAPGEAGRRLSVAGVLFGLGSAVGQAAGSLMVRVGMVGGVSALDVALVRLPAGAVGIVLLTAVAGQLGSFTRTLRKPRVLGAIVITSTIGTFCGIWLSQYAIGHASSTAVATTLLSTSPIFALPLGRWLNREPITSRALGGTLLACVGLTLLTVGNR
jgi:drug/metabolite transporter (DMT)-like permease